MKWQSDLINDIRTFTEFDDQDGGVPHPLGYGHSFDSRGNTISLKDQWLDALQNSSTPQNCLQYYEKCFLFE